MIREDELKWPQGITLWGYESATRQEWLLAEDDADSFAAEWGFFAAALGWTEENVLGLIWSLRGDRVIAMTSRIAAVLSTGGDVRFYRRMGM